MCQICKASRKKGSLIWDKIIRSIFSLTHRLSGEIPHQHTSVIFTNQTQNDRDVSFDSQQLLSDIEHTDERWTQYGKQPKFDDHISKLQMDDHGIGERYLNTNDKRKGYHQMEEDKRNRDGYSHASMSREGYMAAKTLEKERPHFPLSREGYGAAKTIDKERPHFSVFVPTESRKRIDQYRERFDRHLKRKSHQTIGTFDPWSMCDE